MNPKVEEFICKMKEEQEKQKKEHLISLGLIDETKSIETIEYYDVWDGTKECEWVPNEQKYRKKVYKYEALDVTDEEYQEILKYAPISETQILNNKKQVSQTKWANVLYKLGLILSIIIFIGGFVVSFIEESFLPIFYVILYIVLYIPFVIGFARVVEAAEKYLQK